jgi:hypothetical protein
MQRLLIIFVILSASACAYQNDSMDSGSTDGTQNTLDNTEHLLQGTWSRPCQYESNNGYFVEQIAFSGVEDTFAIVTKDLFYSDSGCQTLTLVRSQSMTVTNVEQNGNSETYNATVAAQSYSPQTIQAAAALTNAHACGFTLWTVGVVADTTNTSCNSTGTTLDTISLSQGQLFRALDEILNPNVISGTISTGIPYTKTN